MADLLIRNVEKDVLNRIDATAERLGLSRNEYLRRELVRLAQVGSRAATRDDLKCSLGLLADLGDDTVMAQAW
jgi:hypothetical protein